MHSELSPEQHKDVSLQSLLCRSSSSPALSDVKGLNSKLCSGTHSLLLSLHSSSDYREKSKYSLIYLVNLNIQYLKLIEETYLSDSSLQFVSSSPAVGRTTKSRSGLQTSEPRLLLTIYLYVWLTFVHENRAYITVLFLCFALMNTHTQIF